MGRREEKKYEKLYSKNIAMNEILFGGPMYTGFSPKSPPFREKEGIKNVFDILEKAFIQLTSTDEAKAEYGDPERGASLVQAWRTSGIFTGRWPICLLAMETPGVSTEGIEKVVRMSSPQLVKTAKEILSLSGNTSIQILYYDGQTGHSVTLLRYDKQNSSFHYLDPWPDFSLLSKEYNAAGVDAQRIENNIWSVTEKELEKIITAAFIFKSLWAEYLGEKYFISSSEVKNIRFLELFPYKDHRFRAERGQNRTPVADRRLSEGDKSQLPGK